MCWVARCTITQLTIKFLWHPFLYYGKFILMVFSKKKEKFILMVVPRLNSWPQAWTNGSNIMNTTNMQQTITHNFSPTTGSLTITAVTMTLWVEENEGEFSWTVFSVFSWSPVLIYLRSKIAYYLDTISIYSVIYGFDFVCMYSFVCPQWKITSVGENNCLVIPQTLEGWDI